MTLPSRCIKTAMPSFFAALRDFDAAYTAYADFQRQMEAYWSLVYLQQQGTSELTATILKEDLVRIEGLPLVTRATGIPFDALPKSQALFKITELDAEKQFIALNYQKAVLPADNVIPFEKRPSEQRNRNL